MNGSITGTGKTRTGWGPRKWITNSFTLHFWLPRILCSSSQSLPWEVQTVWNEEQNVCSSLGKRCFGDQVLASPACILTHKNKQKSSALRFLASAADVFFQSEIPRFLYMLGLSTQGPRMWDLGCMSVLHLSPNADPLKCGMKLVCTYVSPLFCDRRDTRTQQKRHMFMPKILNMVGKWCTSLRPLYF